MCVLFIDFLSVFANQSYFWMSLFKKMILNRYLGKCLKGNDGKAPMLKFHFFSMNHPCSPKKVQNVNKFIEYLLICIIYSLEICIYAQPRREKRGHGGISTGPLSFQFILCICQLGKNYKHTFRTGIFYFPFPNLNYYEEVSFMV